MPNLSGPLRLFLAKTYEILSRKRPAKFIRRFQALLISFTLIVVAVVITYPIWNESSPDLRAGGAFDKDKVAPETVLARVDVEFPRLDLYEENKRAAEAAVPFRFERNFSIISGQEGKTLATMLADDVAALKACREKAKNEPAFLACARAIPGFSRLRDVRTLVYLPKIAAKGTEAAIALQEHLLILDKLPDDIQPEAAAVEVRDSGPGKSDTWRALPVESIVLRSQFSQEKTRNLMREVLAQAIPDPYLRSSYLDWILPYIASLEVARYMPEETALARKEAVARLDIPHMRIAAGEPIVKQGDVIRQENRTALEVHARLHLREKAKRITAITLQHFLLLMILVFFAYRFESKRMSDMSANIIFFMNIWIFCGMLFAIETLWHEPNINPEDHIFGSWVPIGIFAVLFSLLSGELFALATAVYLSLLVFGVSQYDPQSFLHSLVMSVMAVWAGTRIRKRIHFLATSIFLMLLAGVLVTMGYLYLNRVIISQSGGDLLTTGYKSAMVKALLMGAATAFTIVILPLYESVFNVPTRFRLQELSDPSTPLLQEFYRLAPSTWNHTLTVASLTEKACERLGLNTLLARTGVYYHDIGKTRRAGFFVENQHLIPKPENIDKNNPEKAAKVIIDHVLDGIEIARKIRLPREVMAFIPEHHGTSTMSFFYHQALEKSRRKVKRENFRYPGPVPQSKETAIVMIADSVEAASRSLDEITEAAVDSLIQKIINIKLAENQFDESGLTMGDLAVIRKAFTEILLSSLHHRPKYPAMEATKKLEQARKG